MTAKAVCENNSKHILTETVQTTYKIITKPTTEKAGKAEYRAVFKNELFETQKKTVILPKKKGRKMFRLYNANTGEHFYTAKDGEKAFLIKKRHSSSKPDGKMKEAAGTHLRHPTHLSTVCTTATPVNITTPPTRRKKTRW